MSDDERAQRWNQRYEETSESVAPDAAFVLTRNSHLLPESGDALDLACGLGGNALLLASHGLNTTAWDSASAALDKLELSAQQQKLKIDTQCRDVVSSPPAGESFDVIVVSRFLHRPLIPALVEALRPSGLLFYQTFVEGSKTGPSNPEYLLKPNELLTLFSGQHDNLLVLFFEDTGQCGNTEAGFRNESMLVVQKYPTGSRESRSAKEEQPELSMTEKFEAMLESGQDSEMLRFSLGSAYYKEGDALAAIPHLEKALEMKPDWSAPWKILGRAYADSDQLEKALDAFEKGRDLAQQHGDKQTLKEIAVFEKRARKALDSE